MVLCTPSVERVVFWQAKMAKQLIEAKKKEAEAKYKARMEERKNAELVGELENLRARLGTGVFCSLLLFLISCYLSLCTSVERQFRESQAQSAAAASAAPSSSAATVALQAAALERSNQEEELRLLQVILMLLRLSSCSRSHVVCLLCTSTGPKAAASQRAFCRKNSE